MNYAGNKWLKDRTERLKAMWAAGDSASVIGRALNVSRNAVIGKVHRLRLVRHSPVNSTPIPRKARRGSSGSIAASIKRKSQSHNPTGYRGVPRISKPPRIPARAVFDGPDLEAPPSLNVSLLDLTSTMCRWPHGNPGEASFGFCGHHNWNSLPYCEAHCRRAYHPATDRRERRSVGG